MPASLDDIATNQKNFNQNFSVLIQTLQALFPRVTGTFTCGASGTVTVSNANVQASTIVEIAPINAAAATLMGGTKSLYQDMSSTVAGTSFTFKTASGVAAAGTEQFAYWFVTPV